MRLLRAIALLAVVVLGGRAEAFDGSGPAGGWVQPVSRQSVFLFAGRTAQSDIWSTAIFNLNHPSWKRNYDNYIVGGAYQRDFLAVAGGLLIGGEVGLADRFGYYKVCCYPAIATRDLNHSAEVWAGVSLRHEGVTFFDRVRFSPGLVVGMSAISSPIGQEALHQVQGTSARMLFYLALEGALSLAERPDTELVLRLHHRSGLYGTIGGLKEGNNANVLGLRQRF